MLITNQQLNKLAILEAIFKSKQMLDGKVLTGKEHQLEDKYYWEIFPF